MDHGSLFPSAPSALRRTRRHLPDTRRAALVLVAVVAAMGGRAMLDPWLREGAAFLFAWPAVAVVALAAPTDPVERVTALPDARGISTLTDGRLAVTRWRSPPSGGQVAILDPSDTSAPPQILTLPFDPQAASDTDMGGVPNYLESFAVSPTGLEAAAPGLMPTYEQARPAGRRPACR